MNLVAAVGSKFYNLLIFFIWILLFKMVFRADNAALEVDFIFFENMYLYFTRIGIEVKKHIPLNQI